MKPNIEELRKKYMDNPPEGMTSKDIRNMSEDHEYSNAIVHAFKRFRAPFSGKIVHIFPEQSAVI